VNVYNTQGEQVFSEEAELITKEQIIHVINVEAFPLGFYNFSIDVGDKTYSGKFIKQ
jgi:hypothetical protein